MKKVLVIEDSPDVHHITNEMLTKNGFKVFVAEDGFAGIEAAKQHLPDLIICDVHMPGMDGFGTLGKIREDASTATIPFIFLTGMGEKPLMRRGMELGADDYLTKPFTLPELIGAVRTQLDKKAAVAQQAEKRLEELRGSISLALPHELLTPLSGILGYASILAEEHRSMRPEEIAEAAQTIHASAGRLRRTIENFLLYSQIELVAADPERVATLLQNEHTHSVENLENVAKQVALRCQRVADLKMRIQASVLRIAPDKLEKLLTELLDNAFKFSPPGTEVRFSTSMRGKKFVLTVEDQGRGLTHEQVQKIGAHMQFERKFYEQQGSGLGLVIVKRLTELHGGQLEIESTPGKRTEVRASFATV